jgi:nucleoside phosphorylase
MKILLVEDSDPKASSVETVLRAAIPNGAIVCHRAKSFRGAVKQLEEDTYDLLLLDLVIPIRDEEAPSEKGGKQVLSEILDGATCHPPSHIICLTDFDSVADQLRDEAGRNLIHIVVYDETGDKWREPLSAKARFVESRIRDSETRPKSFLTDIAIVTSSPLVELKEILKLPGFIAEYHQGDALHYFCSKWVTVQKKQLSVLACAAPSMGMTAACVTASKVIERWRPRFLAMTGIAAATTKKVKFGDILVAEAAYDYGSGKIIETDNRKRKFIASPSQLRIDPGLHAILQQWERDQLGMDAVRQATDDADSTVPRLILGIIASGAAVVQSQELVDEIVTNSRKVVGLDMEAYGVFQASHLASEPRPRVLIAKSVSDFANKQKSDKWQKYAAFTSARFIYEFFTNAGELQIGRESQQP